MRRVRCDAIEVTSVSEAMRAVLGCDREQRNVPCGSGYGRDALTREGRADELGMQPVSAMTEESEAPVVVAGAHADAVSCVVECGQRRDDEVEFPGRDCVGCALRFPDAVTVADESRVAWQADEVHAAGRSDHRYVDDAAAGERFREQVADVDFGLCGKVQTDAPRRMPVRAVREMPADGGGMARACRVVECAAGPLSGLPVYCALGLHGRPCPAGERWHLPPVPSPAVALEPERKVGSAETTQAFRRIADLRNVAFRLLTPTLIVRVERLPSRCRTLQEVP